MLKQFTQNQYRACKKFANNQADIENLGDFIREKREEAGLSIKQLASALDVPSGYLSDMEEGYAMTLGAAKIRLLPKHMNLPKEETAAFFDLAAKASGTMPLDIMDYMTKNESTRAFVRMAMYDGGAKAELCKRFMVNLVKMSDEAAESVLNNVDKK